MVKFLTCSGPAQLLNELAVSLAPLSLRLMLFNIKLSYTGNTIYYIIYYITLYFILYDSVLYYITLYYITLSYITLY